MQNSWHKDLYKHVLFFQSPNSLDSPPTSSQKPTDIPLSCKTHHDGRLFLNAIGCVEFIGLLLFMAGVELNPGPITPGEDKTIKTQDKSRFDDTHNISTPGTSAVAFESQSNNATNPSQLSEEPAAKRFRQSLPEEMEPLREADLVEFAEYITPDHQERMSVMLGFDLNKVETLRCKHRENVTGVSLDLLLDWMTCNPQPTNRLVN